MGEVYIGVTGIVAVLIAIVIYVISQYLNLSHLREQLDAAFSRATTTGNQMYHQEAELAESRRQAAGLLAALRKTRKKLAASKQETAQWKSAHSYVMEREAASKQANGTLYRAQQQKQEQLEQQLAKCWQEMDSRERQVLARQEQVLVAARAECDERVASMKQELAEARSWQDRALASEQKFLEVRRELDETLTWSDNWHQTAHTFERELIQLRSNHEDVCRWLDEAREQLEKSQRGALEQARVWARNQLAGKSYVDYLYGGKF